LLPVDADLRRAIRNLDETALQIVLAVAPDGTLLGTLTDGDIRRGLLRGLDMGSSIESIIFREPLVVPPQLGRDTVLQLMRVNKVHQLPVVDAERRVVGLHLWDELMSPRRHQSPMVIMAGGKGSRLRPHTENCPKPLLLVGDKPILEHILLRAKSQGFGEFIIAVHYLGHMIEEYFGDGGRLGIEIRYLREDVPLGTAGALGLLDQRPRVPFVISNGDVLTDIHYGELLDFHVLHGASATMAVRQYEWQHPFGVVRTNGVDIVGFEEKPVTRSHINAGIYVLQPETLDVLSPREACDMPALFGRLQERMARTIVYPMHEPWLDVGRQADLDKAHDRQNAKPST
jgi:dTDP-glucose pyrophosphorylase